MTTKDDIQEIKHKLDKVDSKLDTFLVAHAREQALIEQRLLNVSGKVNTVIAFTLATISGLAYAAWDFIKHKVGIN